MKKTVLFTLYLISSFSYAQNLIPNPGFEDHTACPSGNFQFYNLNNWFNPTINVPGITGTPDYYNTCATYMQYSVPGTSSYHYQYPSTGDAYVGIWDYYGNSIFPEFREYISVQLSSPLIAGECYQFQMYVNMSNGSNAYSSSIGAYFSDTLINSIDTCLHFPFSPQIINPINNYPDTTNWMLVDGTYAAHGGESYIVLGNFYDNANSTIISIDTNIYKYTYLYVDDVSLYLTSCLGLNEKLESSRLIVAPNPFSEKIVLYNMHEVEEVSIIDSKGKEVYKRNYAENLHYKEVIHCDSFARGVYFLKAKTKKSIYTQKIIKI